MCDCFFWWTTLFSLRHPSTQSSRTMCIFDVFIEVGVHNCSQPLKLLWFHACDRSNARKFSDWVEGRRQSFDECVWNKNNCLLLFSVEVTNRMLLGLPCLRSYYRQKCRQKILDLFSQQVLWYYSMVYVISLWWEDCWGLRSLLSWNH